MRDEVPRTSWSDVLRTRLRALAVSRASGLRRPIIATTATDVCTAGFIATDDYPATDDCPSPWFAVSVHYNDVKAPFFDTVMQVLILNGLAEPEVTEAWQSFAWLPWDVGEDAGPD